MLKFRPFGFVSEPALAQTPNPYKIIERIHSPVKRASGFPYGHEQLTRFETALVKSVKL